MEIKTLDQCNAALKELTELKQAAQKRVMKSVDKELARINEKADEVDRAIRRFGEEQKETTFANSNVVELLYGTLKLVKSTVLEISETTLAKLEKLGIDHVITVKKSVNKTALKKLDEKTLKRVDATIVPKDNFSYKLKAAA